MKYVTEVKHNIGQFRTLQVHTEGAPGNQFTVTTTPGLLTYWDETDGSCFVFYDRKQDMLRVFNSPVIVGYYYEKLIPQLQPAAKKFSESLFRANLDSYFQTLIQSSSRELVRDVFEEWIELSRTDPKMAITAVVESEYDGEPWLPGFDKLENTAYTPSFRLACARLHEAAIKFPWKEQQ